jgi:hypothetical protein
MNITRAVALPTECGTPHATRTPVSVDATAASNKLNMGTESSKRCEVGKLHIGHEMMIIIMIDGVCKGRPSTPPPPRRD